MIVLSVASLDRLLQGRRDVGTGQADPWPPTQPPCRRRCSAGWTNLEPGHLHDRRDLRIPDWNHWLQKQTGRAGGGADRPAAVRDLSGDRARAGSSATTAPRSTAKSACSRSRFHRYLIEIPVRLDGDATVAPMPQSCRIAPLIADGQIVGTITVIDDVTDRVRSEAEMRRQITVGGAGPVDGGRRTPAEGRVPGDAVARDPHAAQRGDRLDADSSSRDGGPRDAARTRCGSSTATHGAVAADRRHARHGADRQRQAAPRARRRSISSAATSAAIDVVAPAAAAKGVRIESALKLARSARHRCGRRPRPADRLEPAVECGQVHAAAAGRSTSRFPMNPVRCG